MDETQGRIGRPRSEQARVAVLHAVDDLLVEVGYAAMTMKGIAERAGVGRQTVYRWWTTKAEILLEASLADAAEELSVTAHEHPVDDLVGYLQAVRTFLTTSPAGSAYLALIAAGQQDKAVADLLAGKDPLASSARDVLERIGAATSDEAVAGLVGPVFYRVASGMTAPTDAALQRLAEQQLGHGASSRPPRAVTP